MSISDRVLLMKKGTCQQFTTPRNMYTNPANKFVAKFLGNPPMNFIDAVIIDGKKAKLTDNIVIDVSNHLKDKEVDKGNITLGIRPEDFIVTVKENAILSGTVSNIQIMGKEIYVSLNIDKDIRVVFVTSWDFKVDVGDKLYLDIKNIHTFSEEDSIEN